MVSYSQSGAGFRRSSVSQDCKNRILTVPPLLDPDRVASKYWFEPPAAQSVLKP